MSGSGKSTLCKKLRELGYCAHDIENIPDMFVTTDLRSGEILKEWDTNNLEQIRNLAFNCDITKLRELIENEPEQLCFYNGTATNIEAVAALFDTVILLQANPETLRHRLTTRTTHDFARETDMQDWILEIKIPFEECLIKRGAIAIDANGDMEDTIKRILEKVKL